MNEAIYSTGTNFAMSDGWNESGIPRRVKSSHRFAPFRSTPQNTTATISAIINMSIGVFSFSIT